MAGEVVHIEFSSADTDRAERFWSGLFGWSFGGAMPGMDYRMAQTGPGVGAAVFPTEDRPGFPLFYFSTDDLDASRARVAELDGEAGDKMPVPGHGWFARCKDSEGNAFGLWEADESAG
jgi:predicted enzyme related to lactoylglutathione lyase